MEALEREFERAPPPGYAGAEPPDIVEGQVIPLFTGYTKSIEFDAATGAVRAINVVPIRTKKAQFPGLPNTAD
jgi:hypothetical protein